MRLFLLDDHEVVRDALKESLERSGFEVVAAAAQPAWPELERCDLLLLDMNLPGTDGLTIIREARRRCPDLRILVLTMDESARSARQALEAGALGYVVKSASRPELLQALETVGAGHLYVHAKVAAALLSRPVPSLTERELQLLKLVAGGLSNPEIAERLSLSRSSVKAHLQELFTRFGVTDRTRLVVEAIRLGLVTS